MEASSPWHSTLVLVQCVAMCAVYMSVAVCMSASYASMVRIILNEAPLPSTLTCLTQERLHSKGIPPHKINPKLDNWVLGLRYKSVVLGAHLFVLVV